MKCLSGFACADALCPSYQLFSHVGMFIYLSGLNHYKAEDSV